VRRFDAQGAREANELFAAWLCLAALMVVARGKALLAAGWPLAALPLAAYQDTAVAALLCAATLAALRSTSKNIRRLVVCLAWIVCAAWGAFTVANDVVFQYFRMPLTLRLLVLSDLTLGSHGIEQYVVEAATPVRVIEVLAAPILIMFAAKLACRFVPEQIESTRRVCASGTSAVFLIFYFVVGSVWAGCYVPYDSVVANPEWSLAASFFERKSPGTHDRFPASYLADFRPSADSAAKTAMTGALPPGTNVVMVVMESVGTRRLQLSGARYHDSPTLIELARHAANLTRTYASMPGSSNAMGGLFCSVYPDHRWQTITNTAPDFPVPSVAAVLAAHGYKSAFVHGAPLSYDREGEFLSRHGFEVHAQSNASGARDQAMLDEGLDWIRRNRPRPFFLVLWTDDTHAPYQPLEHFNFDEKSAFIRRYLDSVASDDELIGRLASRLDEMGLSDNTLLIITGDHGEAFGEHGQFYHNRTTYEEEVRIPLLLVNRRLFPQAVRIDRPAQQIDVAPTILDLLGYKAPGQWQGTSAFAAARSGRVYLCANVERFRLGIVERNLKYIDDYGVKKSQLFNLDTDPFEQKNLIRDPQYAAFAWQEHQRLAAWLAFQDAYLDQLRGVKREDTPAGLKQVGMLQVPVASHVRPPRKN
jgi:arylsulfatase A-like enzyme